MTRQMRCRMLRVMTLAGYALALGSCSSNGQDGSTVYVFEKHPDTIPFEQYRDKTPRIVVDGRHLYNVEWDLYFSSEDDLHRSYLTRLNEEVEKSVVLTQISTGKDLTWTRNAGALNIRYCVSNSFGTKQ